MNNNNLFISNLLQEVGVSFIVSGRFWGSFNPYKENDLPEKGSRLFQFLDIHDYLPFRVALLESKLNYTYVGVSSSTLLSRTDALICNSSKLPLTLFTADCASVALVDVNKSVLVLAHIGRVGAEQGFINILLNVLKEDWHVNPKDIKVSIGPYIGSCGLKCYEVGASSAELLYDICPETFVSNGDFGVYVNFGFAIVEHLLIAGVKEKNIEMSQTCTNCNKSQFFSYRNRSSYEKEIKANNGVFAMLH